MAFLPFSYSLDSEFLVSTSTDGSARIWNIDEGAPLVNLTRSLVQYDNLLISHSLRQLK
jgi:WD40 repeat protein